MNPGPELSPQAAAQIEAALARGHKIEAIKLYRDATHCGLKEAKDAIERMQPTHSNPVVTKPGSNWLTTILALLILAVVLIIILIQMH